MNYKYFCFMLLIGLAACINDHKKEDEELNSVRFKLDQIAELDDIFELESVIFLDNMAEALLSSPKKMVVTDSLIFILDNINMEYNRVVCFNQDGDFVRLIGAYGRGPGEFQLAEDINLIPEHGEIEVYAFRDIFRYMYDGTFIEKEDFFMREGIYHMLRLEDDTFVIVPVVNKEAFIISDISMQTKNGYINRPASMSYTSATATIARSYSGIHATYALNDTIYKVTKDGLVSKYALDFGEYGISRSRVPNSFDLSTDNIKNYISFEKEMKSSKIVWKHQGYEETKEFGFFWSHFGNSRLLFLIDRKNLTGYVCNAEICGIEIIPATYSNDFCYVMISSDKLVQFRDQGALNHRVWKNPAISEKLRLCGIMDNNIVLKLRLRKEVLQ